MSKVPDGRIFFGSTFFFGPEQAVLFVKQMDTKPLSSSTFFAGDVRTPEAKTKTHAINAEIRSIRPNHVADAYSTTTVDSLSANVSTPRTVFEYEGKRWSERLCELAKEHKWKELVSSPGHQVMTFLLTDRSSSSVVRVCLIRTSDTAVLPTSDPRYLHFFEQPRKKRSAADTAAAVASPTKKIKTVDQKSSSSAAAAAGGGDIKTLELEISRLVKKAEFDKRQHDAQLAEAVDKTDGLVAEAAGLRKAIDDANAQFVAVSDELKAVKAQQITIGMGPEYEALNAKHKATEATLAETTKELEKANANLEQLTANTESTKALEYEALNAKYNASEATVAEMTDAAEKSKAELARLTAESEALQKVLEENSTTIAALKKAVDSKRTDGDVLSKHAAEVKRLSDHNADLANQLNSLKDKQQRDEHTVAIAKECTAQQVLRALGSPEVLAAVEKLIQAPVAAAAAASLLETEPNAEQSKAAAAFFD